MQWMCMSLALGFVCLNGAFAMATGTDAAEILVTDPAHPSHFLRKVEAKTGRSRSATLLSFDRSSLRQEIEGYGAALTDSSVLAINSLPAGKRSALLRELFDPVRGLNMNYLRIPLGATDFGTKSYSYLDLPAGQEDPELTQFSLRQAAAMIRLLHEIQGINPDLKLLLSPWSPPAWMKTSGQLHGGSLKKEHYGTFARYLLKSISAFEGEGFTVDSLTIQNEPYFSTEQYPTMGMDENEQIEFIRDFLYPALRSAGEKTKILALDHNYDLRPQADMIAAALGDKIAGVAYHCYGGDYLEMANSTTPIYQTECTSGTWGDFAGSLRYWLDTQVIGAGLIGGKLAMGWNLALNEKHGPYFGYCDNCRGLVDIHSKSKKVTFNPELIALAHAGKFLRPGSHRIESLPPLDGNYSYIAYLNPNQSVVVVVQNLGASLREFVLPGSDGVFFRFSVPAGGVASIRLP
jgi:glucosylceramidase